MEQKQNKVDVLKNSKKIVFYSGYNEEIIFSRELQYVFSF